MAARAGALGRGRAAARKDGAWQRLVHGYTRREKLILGILGLVLFLALWELAADAGLLNPVIVSSPSRVGSAFGGQWTSGQLLADLSVTMIEFVVGFGLSIVIGVVLGIAMGLSRLFEYMADPFVWFIYSAPLIALYPLLIVWLGLGIAYFSPYPVGFWTTSFAFGLYLLVAGGRAVARKD